MERKLDKPAKIFGLHIGLAGSDVTTAGSSIRVSGQMMNGSWKTLINLTDAAVSRGFSGPGGTVLSPITMKFPEIEVSKIRIEMKGNGWFGWNASFFHVRGCTE